MNSPYLAAIQRIPGLSPGEKFLALNKAAASVVSSKLKDPSICPELELKSLGIPEPLIPLAQVEVAKGLRDPEGLIQALRSEDELVFERALTAKWFFDGSNPEVTNPHFYGLHIFPHISLNHRRILVKKLSVSLAYNGDKSGLAESFYSELSWKYGKKCGEPLLIACSEGFIRKLIVEERQVALSIRFVQIIYQRHPNVIIDYLKLTGSKKAKHSMVDVDLFYYSDFLPTMMKKNMNSFVEIIEMHGSSWEIQFSRKRTELFMKQGIEALVRSPRAFLPMMPLKVTGKLSREQFRLMFRNLFPKEIHEFQFRKMFGYLEFCQEEDKIGILLETFREVYGSNLLESKDQVTPEVMRALPVEERVRQARRKLEVDQDWHLGQNWQLKNSWRCYLLVDESIPLIKTQIGRSSNVNDRRDLMQQLIYTCAVNEDKGALLEVLKYICVRHKNEQPWMLLEVLAIIPDNFQVQDLTVDHWVLLDDIIQLLHMKNQLQSRVYSSENIITTGIHFRFINDLPIDEKIDLLIELYRNSWRPTWNIVKENPNCERKCLESFLEKIGRKYPENHKVWEGEWSRTNITTFLVEAVNSFNTRNSENKKSELENLSLRSYPWLILVLEKILNDKDEPQWERTRLSGLLKDTDKDLWDAIVSDKSLENSAIDMRSIKIIVLLKRNPKEILENWESYLNSVYVNINSRLVQRFLRSCRWHQELPIKFSEKTLSSFETERGDGNIIILSLLYEGESFERLITPFIPKKSTIDPKNDEKTDVRLLFTIPMAFNLVNPPVSLDVILKFCIGDYIHSIINCFATVGRRVSADKVIAFCRKLMEKGVSIKKHGIRLFVRVAKIDEITDMLRDQLRKDKHRSIRAIVYKSILELFVNQPSQDIWGILVEAVNDLRGDDDSIKSLATITKIPDEFLADYVKMLLRAIRRLEGMEGGLSREQALATFSDILYSIINVVDVFPEELHHFILKEFFFDLSQPHYALSNSMQNYVICGYLEKAGDNLGERLIYFQTLLAEVIVKYWDADGDKPGKALLGNYFVFQLSHIIRPLISPVAKTVADALFTTIFSVLRPQQEPTCYLYLIFTSAFDKPLSPKDFAGKILEILPSLVNALSRESLPLIAKALFSFIELRISHGQGDVTVLEIMEEITELGDVDFTIMASIMLASCSRFTCESRFWRVVRKLQKHRDPAVVANVYSYVNQLEPK
ncbi:uncharacterized protein [Fopius arisanus]|uniref:Uncharacterized protein n=1 Tax=Fopius arisanus TaxID=64838 RepID=A0A9R1TT74_9HYME|nr:PREDICTED: uncharacterized protein LOC105273860 [Fopius arisanus]XP_011314845.1 PREDICTED: uncharacterized protein LOC105273860 [Fopius arisanus]